MLSEYNLCKSIQSAQSTLHIMYCTASLWLCIYSMMTFFWFRIMCYSLDPHTHTQNHGSVFLFSKWNRLWFNCSAILLFPTVFDVILLSCLCMCSKYKSSTECSFMLLLSQIFPKNSPYKNHSWFSFIY